MKSKKIIGLLCGILALQLTGTAYAADNVLYGDADGSGALSANDAAVILNAVLQGTDASEEDIINNYDVDFSGIITSNDGANVLYKVLNNAYTLPVEVEMNREIQPESCILSQWNGDRDIFEGNYDVDSRGTIYDIRSKGELDAFLGENPEINRDAFLERIYSEFGRNFLANRNLIIAIAPAYAIEYEYEVRDVSVSEGALCISMDSTVDIQSTVIDSRLVLVTPGKNQEYGAVRFTVDNYNRNVDTGERTYQDTEVWELNDSELSRLEITDTGWAYPNVAYWSLGDYPENSEQNYLVTLYKNGSRVGEYPLNLTPEEAGAVSSGTARTGAHIDFTDVIGEDVTGEYTFSVKALGDGVTTADSEVVMNDVPYIYSSDLPGVAVSADNTIQLKLMNIALPYQWKYSLDNDNIRLTSRAVDFEYNTDYDFTQSMPGSGSCERYNFEAVKPGEVTIRFDYCSVTDESVVEDSKTVTLRVNEDLSVDIIS